MIEAPRTVKEIHGIMENASHRKQNRSMLHSTQTESKPETYSINNIEIATMKEKNGAWLERSRVRRSRSMSSKSSSDNDSNDRTDAAATESSTHRRSPSFHRRSPSVSRHRRTTRAVSQNKDIAEPLYMPTAAERSTHRRSASPRRSMHRRRSLTGATDQSSRSQTPRRSSLVESPFPRQSIRSTGGPRRLLTMPRVGDAAAPQVPTLVASKSSTPVTPRQVTRHSSAQLQKVNPPLLNRTNSAGKELEHPRTPIESPSNKSGSGSPREKSVRRTRTGNGLIRSKSDDSQRQRQKTLGETVLKKSPSRRRTVARSLAGLEISIEIQEALFPTSWTQRKSQLCCKAYALKSENHWVEKATQPVVMAGHNFPAVTLCMSLSCDEAKDFLKSDDDYKPIEIRIYDGIHFRGSIQLPMHTTKPSWFFSIDDSPFEICARVTLEGSTMHEIEAGSVLENVPSTCIWHCKLLISVIAITKKHGLVHWEECLSASALSSKSGTLERVSSSSVQCNLKNLPESVAALFFIVVNDSPERVSCRLEQGVGLGRMTIPANQTVVLGRITLETNSFEMMGVMQSFPVVSDLGALIPMLHHCARDNIQDPVNVGRTAWMRPDDCIQLHDYCPQLTSLVVDIRCKKGDVMAIFLDERGRRVDIVDKQNLKSRDRSATMNRKMIELELQRVGVRIQTIAFITTAEFACHVWNPATEAQVIRFVDCAIDSSYGYKHLLVGCLIRSEESSWNFWALGLPTKSNSLHALCEYVHNLHPLPSPSSLFPIEPFETPIKVYLGNSEGLIPADQLLKAVKVSQ